VYGRVQIICCGILEDDNMQVEIQDNQRKTLVRQTLREMAG